MAQCILLGHVCQHDAHMRTEGMGAGEGREQTETDSRTRSARHTNATRDKPAGVAKAAAHEPARLRAQTLESEGNACTLHARNRGNLGEFR